MAPTTSSTKHQKPHSPAQSLASRYGVNPTRPSSANPATLVSSLQSSIGPHFLTIVETYTENLKADYEAHYKDILIEKEKLNEENKAKISKLVDRVSYLEDELSDQRVTLEVFREAHGILEVKHLILEKEHTGKKGAAEKLETIQKRLLGLVKDWE
ncbi:hypothetical protein PtrSN002B_006557 [Pyrenophora tritici-repentis]|uniref:Uncharacterized protein n=2 Tax=Pyrenophora tritici-repentis TaxID=45151 RepID=A0A2W1F9F6_9PLEO|nr:uncharacterized protein PTRG_06117 [Pyrenophora tritici-repentis Pt-1C-BFP]KAA8619248.1 hypothetical protein PtrV1_08677 [Pyrenophora tritici-repentis]EDU49037.1 predicted protein [Pyrenophora tritici-repentis Pt-1C-BFP]KAF7449718.1 hypothetical protein A1F99_067670 [Pyrenophora tritici-repentis]KAF7570156.1 hypothetical protein PtrM4_101580 [Pyrenophora tritici-repentis]KAG9383350.1 hypothetical protein A1F94_005261 [Pyrenophora tritici-repentis]